MIEFKGGTSWEDCRKGSNARRAHAASFIWYSRSYGRECFWSAGTGYSACGGLLGGSYMRLQATLVNGCAALATSTIGCLARSALKCTERTVSEVMRCGGGGGGRKIRAASWPWSRIPGLVTALRSDHIPQQYYAGLVSWVVNRDLAALHSMVEIESVWMVSPPPPTWCTCAEEWLLQSR